MRRGKRGKKWIIPLIFLIIMGFIFYTNREEISFPQFAGFTTMSVSDADFISSSDFFNGESTYIVTVSVNGMGQSLIITPEDFKKKGSPKIPTKQLKLEMDGEQFCEYSIEPTYEATPIYAYQIHVWDGGLFAERCTEDYAETNGCPYETRMGYGKFSGSLTCFCINEITQAKTLSVNGISNPDVRTRTKIKLTSDFFSETKEFDTKGKVQGYIGDNAYVIWNGDLVKSSCNQNQDRYYAFFRNGEWYLGYSADYINYKNIRDINIEILNNKGGDMKEDTVRDALNRINLAASVALTDRTNEFGIIEGKTNIQNAIIRKDLPSFVQTPVWTFYIKASSIGIYQPVSDIKIINVDLDNFRTAGTIYVDLKNYGETGNADVYAVCDGAEVLTTTQTVYLAENKATRIPINVRASTLEPKKITCTVYSVNPAGNTYKTTTEATVYPEQQCTAGTKMCNGNNVVICNHYGSGFELYESCDVDEYCSNGECLKQGETPTTKPPADSGNDGKTGEPKLPEISKDDEQLIGYAILITAIMVSGAFIYKKRKRRGRR